MAHRFLDRIVSEAMESFWQTVASMHPETVSGDLPPDASQALGNAMREALETWRGYNVSSVSFARCAACFWPVNQRRATGICRCSHCNLTDPDTVTN